MKNYNVLAGVVEVVEAESPEHAIDIVNGKLLEAGFEPYVYLRENLPDGYEMAYEVRE